MSAPAAAQEATNIVLVHGAFADGSGWRGVYEPEAVCYEETSGRFRSEYKRRVRIVSRS